MFGNTTDHMAEVLMRMQDEARVVCKHNQSMMAQQMARWMGQDRRFDSVRDKVALAREAMDCRSHGRTLDLSPRQRSNANSTIGTVVRLV
jgi:hypothetical protein